MKKMSLPVFIGFIVSLGLVFVPALGGSNQVDWEIELDDLDGEYYSRMSEDGWSSLVRGAGHGITGTISGDNGTLGQEVDLSAEGSRFEREETGTIDGVNFSFGVIVEGTGGIEVQDESQYLGDNFVWGAPPGEDFLLKTRGEGFVYWNILAERPDEIFEKIKVSEVGNELIISDGVGLLYAPNPNNAIYPVAQFDGDAIYSPGDTELLGSYAEGSYGNFTLFVSGDTHIKSTILGAGLDQDIGTLLDAYYLTADFMSRLSFSGVFEGPVGSLQGPSGEQLVSFDFEGS